MKRWFLMITLAWVMFVAFPTIPAVRVFLSAPLVVEDPDPRGDACYVLADAGAFRERLGAAAHLYNLGRIARIIFMRDNTPSAYNFVARAHWTSTDWALDFLTHRGVPRDRIIVIDAASGILGTLREARNLGKLLPQDVKKLVLVSSAPHMRRSMLTFRRVLPREISLVSCPATPYTASYEYYYPIWIEYLKLAVYAIVAR
jgi:uncharacterized SAM-binding protein YcdF (DUF218 family)